MHISFHSLSLITQRVHLNSYTCRLKSGLQCTRAYYIARHEDLPPRRFVTLVGQNRKLTQKTAKLATSFSRATRDDATVGTMAQLWTVFEYQRFRSCSGSLHSLTLS